MEREVKWAVIVSCSTAAERGKEGKGKRERECVCVCVRVCWLRMSRFNDSKMQTEWGKAQCKTGARLRHYLPAAHGAVRGFYICQNYLLTV